LVGQPHRNRGHSIRLPVHILYKFFASSCVKHHIIVSSVVLLLVLFPLPNAFCFGKNLECEIPFLLCWQVQHCETKFASGFLACEAISSLRHKSRKCIASENITSQTGDNVCLGCGSFNDFSSDLCSICYTVFDHVD